MKMKIIVVLLFFIIILIFSYSNTNKEEINYTILGDKNIFSNNIFSKNFSDLIYDKLKDEKTFGFYSEDFIKENLRIIDVINQINENEKIDNIYMQNILKRTNLLILNIGNNEINYKLSKNDLSYNDDKKIYNYLDDVQVDLIKLLELLKKYNDKQIIVLGYFNDTNNEKNNKYYKYINKKLEKYCKNNNIEFINLFNILNKNNDYITKTSNVYITNEGNLAIFNTIYSKIDNFYLHKKY